MGTDLDADLRMMVTRVKVQTATQGARTLLQLERFEGEVFSDVEHLMPPGYAALPADGADGLMLHVMARGDHKVVLGGDKTGDAPPDLSPGESGLSKNGGAQRIIQRAGYTEIVDPAAVRIVSPVLLWSPDGVTFYRLATDQHTHPDVQPGSTPTPLPTTGLT